ncbi:DUF2063 domain-containing protein [Pseudomonas sp. CM25]|uniref:HvfC/BufC N-terminal domain-containing protein n=1 Tax=Pseudomonas sp. CM25 TaxID=2738448 RepID=UPI001553AE42|nr:DNA-binding domain-containing protein [Pseudomonas sp. CM25]NQD55198.1 DUF2063 domain-containing protein [Pseudomonas sp. CM25]
MNRTLAHFQDTFIQALYHGSATGVAAQPGFAVYRNTVFKGCVDALCDNFPSVERLVGRDWLADVAGRYARQYPPPDARLIAYGETFADYLAPFACANGLTYLADVARLDWLWLQAFCAEQAPALDVAELAGMTASDLARCTLQPRRSARWQWFAEHPVYTLWHHNRLAQPLPEHIAWHGEGVLLVGDVEGVGWQALTEGACAFLDACANGHDLDRASALALQAEPGLDFNALLGSLLGAQALAPLSLPR